MNFGKLLAILGGVLTIIAMYLFTLFEAVPYFSYAIGGFITLNSVVVNSVLHAGILGVGEWVIYLILAGYVVFVTTGFIQLGGVSKKLPAIIGSVIPLLVGIFLLINGFTGALSGFRYAIEMFSGPGLNEIYFPIHFEIGGIGFGTYLMILGSTLTLVSVFIKKETKN